MDSLEKTIRLNSLYDLYKNLLTDKQRQYFEAYYFKDQSLSEVADMYGVSRNAIYSQLSEIEKSLEDFELKLNLKKKNEKKTKLLDELKKNADDNSLVIIKKLEEI